MQKSCAICQATLFAKRRDARYCSPRCARRGTKPCSAEGCERPSCVAQPVRLCSTHYNQQHQPNRHAKSMVDCGWCGRPTLKHTSQRYGARFCSLTCRDTWRRRDKLPVLFMGHVVRPTAQPGPAPTPRAWVAGRCRHCTQPFLDRHLDARYCSKRCGRRYHRRDRRGEVPEATRLYVLERDGWRCQICRRGIPATLAVPHHMAGTVDHVVPRSQGGSHDPANLRAAHFICNTLRGNRGGGEQLALIG